MAGFQQIHADAHMRMEKMLQKVSAFSGCLYAAKNNGFHSCLWSVPACYRQAQ